MKILLILLLLPLLSIPVAFGQVEETTGQNYDLTEDFNIGQATWSSHPERIMNGQWENYVLTNTNDKVIFNTNAVGTFIFDKNSCSYSIWENGYTGTNIIPSVSAVATYLDNGSWQNLPINNEACVVTVSEYDEGVNLTSTKVITQDITEDVFISYTGTDELFFANSTNSAFTLQKHLNGTNIGYFNGETITTTGIVVDKFVQELNLDIRNGFKETFKIWHDGNQELGISQTVHTSSEIEIADQVIDIQALNGQSFDKQFIEDNEAEILKLTDSINYDFDTGIKSLTNVNIIFDGDYKVNMDYSSGNDGIPFVGYLEIDPTITTTGSGTFDVTPLHTHIISSGTIDGVALSGTQVTALQVDIDATNQYHTLAGTTLIVSYTVSTVPAPPTSLTTTTGIPIVTSWTAPIDDGDDTITAYQVFRTTNAFTQVELPNSSGSDSELTFTDNEFLIHGFESDGTTLQDKSTNSVSVTYGLVPVPTDFEKTSIGSTHSSTGQTEWDLATTSDWNTDSGVYDDVPSSADFVLNIDWEKGGGDNPYFTIQSDTTYAGTSPPTGEKMFKFSYANNDDDIRYSLRYNNNIQQNDVNSSGTNFGNNVIGYFQIIKSGNTMDYARYGSDADRASQTNALQSTATLTLHSLYTSTNDFRYITHGYDGSAGTNTLHNVELWIGTDSLDPVQIAPTSTTGSIGTALQDPNLVYTDTDLPDATDNLSVGGYVKLDETTTTITNPVGTSTNNASPSVSTGLLGNGWEMDSTTSSNSGGDYVALTTSPIPSGTTLFTQNFWFNSDVTNPVSIFQQGASGNDLYGMLCSGAGNNCEVYLSSSGLAYYQFNSAVFAQNTWKMITIVYDGSGSGNSDKLKVFIDGTQHTSGSYSSTIPSSTGGNTDPFHMGARGTNGYSGGDATLDGTFDEWAWWSSALSQSDITSLYNSGSGVLSDTISPSTLTTYYDFEDTGTTLSNHDIVTIPANTKLLGLNDVTFSVGTTTASVSVTPTFEDDFESDTWTGAGNSGIPTTVTISGGDLSAVNVAVAGDDRMYKAIGTTLSNTAWVLQFETNVSSSGSGEPVPVGFVDGTTNLNGESILVHYNGGALIMREYNGSSLTEVGSGISISTGTQYYVTVIRTALDGVTLEVRTGSHTGTLVGSESGTITGSVDLDTIQSGVYGRGSGTASYDIDNVKIYDGITSAPTGIISATGLTDNASTAQHYAFTRDGSNGWTLYQNGVSRATATDSTSLGANSVSGTETQSSTNENTNVTAGECSGQTFTSSATIYGKTITSFDMDLKRNGSETGTLQMGVFDGQTCAVKTLFRTIDSTTLPTSYASYSSGTGSHIIATGEVVGIKWATGSGVEIKYASQNTQVYDGTNSYNMEMGSALTTRDAKFVINHATPSDYSTKISGTLDEFFINSDTLTTAEILGMSNRGTALTALASTNSATTAYSDSAVVGGTTYYYSAKTVNSIGTSDYLTPFVSGLAGTPPDPATGVTASIPNTATAPLDVTVSFSPSGTVGTGTVTGFQLLRDGVAVATAGLVTSMTDTVPAGGTTYAYTVITLGTHGNSVASASSSVTTPNTPAQVTGLTVTPVSTSRIDLSWSTPSANNSLISGYKVQISSNGGSSWSDVLTGNVNTTYQSLSLATNSQYHYKVSAINGVGTGTASAISNTYTMTPTPASLSATPVSEVQINLSWGASTGATGYKVEYESPTGNGFTTHTANTGNTDLTKSITGLTTATQYNFRVSGINAGGASVASPEASSYTWGILTAPTLDTITRLTSTSLKLDFTAGGGLPVATGYKIERQTGSGWIELIADTASTSLTFTDTVLSSDQTATYRLYAINNIGTSPVSNERTSDAIANSGGGGGGSSKAVSSQTGITGLIDLTFIDQIHRVILGEFLSKSINVAWDSSENIEVKSIIVSDSPFRIVFQDVPFVLIGDPSGISNGKINYSVQIPSELCTTQGQINCVEQRQYDIPVEIQSVHKSSTLTKSSVIKIDLAGGSDIPLVFVLLAIGAVPLAFIIRKIGSGKKKRKASGSSHKSSKNGSNSKKMSM